MIKLKELISERRVSVAVYSNNKGNEARVMSNKDIGKSSNPKGFYVEVDFKYDKELFNCSSPNSCLKISRSSC